MSRHPSDELPKSGFQKQVDKIVEKGEGLVTREDAQRLAEILDREAASRSAKLIAEEGIQLNLGGKSR